MDIVAGAPHRLPDQEEEVVKNTFKQSKKSRNHRP